MRNRFLSFLIFFLLLISAAEAQAPANGPVLPVTVSNWTASKVSGSFSDAGTSGGQTLSMVLPPDSTHFEIHLNGYVSQVQPNSSVSFQITFDSGASFSFYGLCTESEIVADLDDSLVTSWTHHLTADKTMSVTFNSIRETPWVFSLSGTTPTINAVANAIKVAEIHGLPGPWNIDAVAQQAGETNSLTSSNQGQPNSPDASDQNQPASSEPSNVTAQPQPDQRTQAQSDNTNDETPDSGSPSQVTAQDQNDQALAPQEQSNISGSPNSSGGVLAFLGTSVSILLFIGAILYFLPYVVARSRHSTMSGLVFLLNLFLGWTIIGWFGALLIALFSPNAEQAALQRAQLDEIKYQRSLRGRG